MVDLMVVMACCGLLFEDIRVGEIIGMVCWS